MGEDRPVLDDRLRGDDRAASDDRPVSDDRPMGDDQALSATLPPGPRLPGIVQAVLMLSRPEQFLQHCARRFGRTFTIRIGQIGTYVYLTDPADIREVFRGDVETFHAGEANGLFLEPLLGPSSVLVTDGAVHRRQRRLMMRAFHGDSVARLAPLMADIAAEEIERWPVGRPFAVRPHFQAMTLEVILRTVIGAEEDDSLRRLRQALPPVVDLDLLAIMQFAVPRLRKWWPWRMFREVEACADAAIYEEIDRCRHDPDLDARSDVLATLVRARDDDGTALSDDELRDQLVTLLIAGHETTATGLAWALERLVRHRHVLARAQEAARQGDDVYLDAVVAETLRVRPVVPDINRRLTRPARVAGHLLPAGTMVDPAIPVVHKSPRHYRQSDEFRPERFVGSPPDPALWLPFGGGNRRCLGASFAATEMRVILREVLRRVDLEPSAAPGEPTKVRHVTLVPRRGARVTVSRRVPVRDAVTATRGTARRV
jgi:cytochrome P450